MCACGTIELVQVVFREKQTTAVGKIEKEIVIKYSNERKLANF